HSDAYRASFSDAQTGWLPLTHWGDDAGRGIIFDLAVGDHLATGRRVPTLRPLRGFFFKASWAGDPLRHAYPKIARFRHNLGWNVLDVFLCIASDRLLGVFQKFARSMRRPARPGVKSFE